MTDDSSTTPFAARVRAAIERMRPALQMDGGDLELVEADESSGVVRVSLTGACVGCSNQSTTVAFGVERAMKQMVPEVEAVEAVPAPTPLG